MASESQERSNQQPQLEHPIPPPTHDKQYRAIGLVWGIYEPQTQLTRGQMRLEDETTIETVLLGRVISVIKKHINLNVPHLWVVYPRTRQKQDYLHLQIAGIWEPTTLSQSSQRAEQLHEQRLSEVQTQAGYFSIRGELVFYSQQEEKIIMKIKQGSTKPPKFFKLKLRGTLPEDKEMLGWFWELDVQLQGLELVVTKGQKIAPIWKKRHSQKKPSTSSYWESQPTPRPNNPPSKRHPYSEQN